MIRWPRGTYIFHSFSWSRWWGRSWCCCSWCWGKRWRNIIGRTPRTESNNWSPKKRLCVFNYFHFVKSLEFRSVGHPVEHGEIFFFSFEDKLLHRHRFLFHEGPLWLVQLELLLLKASLESQSWRYTFLGFLSLGRGLREDGPSLEARVASRAVFRSRIACICWWAIVGLWKTSTTWQIEDPIVRPTHYEGESKFVLRHVGYWKGKI